MKTTGLYILSACVITLAFTFSCKKAGTTEFHRDPPQPDGTTYSYTHGGSAVASLGRVLFYDKNLSLNNTISCGSCHKQQFAFADNQAFSVGLNNGYTKRNASAILDNNTTKFWDGRAGNFDTAVFMPVQNHVEMSIYDLNILPDRLSQISYYPALFTSAYGSPSITVAGIRQALATFLQNFTSTNSKYDQSYTWPTSQTVLLTGMEKAGQNLFNGKAMCYECHSGNTFNGWGANYQNIGLDVVYEDNGRGNITHSPFDDGKFNVPTLRNIALSAPYMHDGRYKTLREVIDHYSDNVQNNPNLSWVFRSNGTPGGLGLTDEEKKQLEAFLNTLTDVTFVTDPKFSDPFH